MISFLSPVAAPLQSFAKSQMPLSLGRSVLFYHPKDHQWLNADVCVFSIAEYRGSGIENNFDQSAFREQFYALYPGNWPFSIADMGTLLPGNDLNDTYAAVTSIVSSLLKKHKLVILLGGSQDLSYAQYRAYDVFNAPINVSSIDSCVDLGDLNTEDQRVSAHLTHIGKMIYERPYRLLNLYQIGYQTYYVPQETLDLIESLNFEYYRLGTIVSDLREAEPALRDSQMLSVDLSAIESLYAPAQARIRPNGLKNREICALMRYAGLSNNLNSLGIYEWLPETSDRKTPELLAQMMWYFIEGYALRNKRDSVPYSDDAISDDAIFDKYHVFIDNKTHTFLKNKKDYRWWMHVSLPNTAEGAPNEKYIPCTEKDYLDAVNGLIPNRFWKTYKKYL